MIIKKFLSIFVAISLVLSNISEYTGSNTVLAQELHRTATIGETNIAYTLPTPPRLELTPPEILTNPPSDARIVGLGLGVRTEFAGVLYNAQANAWLATEAQMAPERIQLYRDAIVSQMTAWTYMELDRVYLRMATETEENRLEVASLEREVTSMRRLRRRSTLHSSFITGSIALLLGIVVGSTLTYKISRK